MDWAWGGGCQGIAACCKNQKLPSSFSLGGKESHPWFPISGMIVIFTTAASPSHKARTLSTRVAYPDTDSVDDLEGLLCPATIDRAVFSPVKREENGRNCKEDGALRTAAPVSSGRGAGRVWKRTSVLRFSFMYIHFSFPPYIIYMWLVDLQRAARGVRPHPRRKGPSTPFLRMPCGPPGSPLTQASSEACRKQATLITATLHINTDQNLERNFRKPRIFLKCLHFQHIENCLVHAKRSSTYHNLISLLLWVTETLPQRQAVSRAIIFSS